MSTVMFFFNEQEIKASNFAPTQEAYSDDTLIDKRLHIFISLGHQSLASLKFQCVTIK